jgi:hypothetical protein
MPPRFNLTVLVRDLLLGADLRRRFNRDPEGVMTDYGLIPDERAVLYSMDPDVIKGEVFPPVGDQVKGFSIPAGEYQPESTDCLPDPGVTLPQYPQPKPALFRVRPRILSPSNVLTVKDQNGNVVDRFFEIVIHGQSFSRVPASVPKITHQTTGAALVAQQPLIFGTMRCSELRVLVKAPTTSAGLGSYDVAVVTNPGTAQEKQIENKLELVITN